MRARGLTQDDLGQLVSSMRAYYAGMGCFAPTCGRSSLDLRAWWAVIPGGEHGFLKNLAGHSHGRSADRRRYGADLQPHQVVAGSAPQPLDC